MRIRCRFKRAGRPKCVYFGHVGFPTRFCSEELGRSAVRFISHNITTLDGISIDSGSSLS